MVTTYEYLRSIENEETFVTLLNKGLIPLSVLSWKVYYERFMQELEMTDHKAQAITNTADEYNCCENTIRRAIKFMEK